MSAPWLRLWTEMPTDIKFGSIATKSGQSVSEVQAVYLQLLVNASNNDDNRGSLHHFYPEDVADYLRIKTEQVEAIMAAMQGKLLDGDKVMGWEARQPVKDDGAAERAKAWRNNKLSTENVNNSAKTVPNATERQRTLDTDADTDADTDINTAHAACGQLDNPKPPAAPPPTAPPAAPPPAIAATVPEPEEVHQIEIFDDRVATALAVCAALKACGINHVSPRNASLVALVQRGADVGQFIEAAHKARSKGKGLAYLLGTVKGQLDDAQGPTNAAMATAAGPYSGANRGAHSGVRSRPDPTLARLEADRLLTGPPPAHIRALLAQLSKSLTRASAGAPA